MRLGHVDMSIIQNLVRVNLLPKGLSTCKIPKCYDYLFGKKTRGPVGTSNKMAGKYSQERLCIVTSSSRHTSVFPSTEIRPGVSLLLMFLQMPPPVFQKHTFWHNYGMISSNSTKYTRKNRLNESKRIAADYIFVKISSCLWSLYRRHHQA